MELFAREQVKVLLAQDVITLKELANALGKELGKKYSSDNLSHKLRNGSIPYNEMVIIARILGYKIKFEKE
jgi:hypothetical protein